MSDVVDDHHRNAAQAEINACWADDPDLRKFWKDLASNYQRLAAAAERGLRRGRPTVESGVDPPCGLAGHRMMAAAPPKAIAVAATPAPIKRPRLMA